MNHIATIEPIGMFGLQIFTLLIGGFSLLFLLFCLGCAVSDLFSKLRGRQKANGKQSCRSNRGGGGDFSSKAAKISAVVARQRVLVR